MMKKILLLSGIVCLALFLAGQFLQLRNSSLADFTQALSLLALLLFLCTLFLTKAGKLSIHRPTRRAFRIFRVAALLGIVHFLWLGFYPRHYGSPVLTPRAGTRYWQLSDGTMIAYTLIPGKGKRKCSPLIYLQGGPGGPIGEGDILKLTPLSEDGYDVYLYDQIGCGFSDRLSDIRGYTAERHVKDLEEIVAAIGAEKVNLLGQSWGAILAVLYIADHPTKIEKVVFTGPGPIYPMRRELRDLQAPDSLHLRAPYYTNAQGNREANNIRTRILSWCALNWGKKLADDAEADDFGNYLNTVVDRSIVCDTGKLKEGKLLAGIGYYAQLMTAKSLGRVKDPRPGLKNSPIPILVMKGQCDNQAWGFTHEYLELFSHHRLVVVSDAGHAISLEQPIIYLTTIREFLNE